MSFLWMAWDRSSGSFYSSYGCSFSSIFVGGKLNTYHLLHSNSLAPVSSQLTTLWEPGARLPVLLCWSPCPAWFWYYTVLLTLTANLRQAHSFTKWFGYSLHFNITFKIILTVSAKSLVGLWWVFCWVCGPIWRELICQQYWAHEHSIPWHSFKFF